MIVFRLAASGLRAYPVRCALTVAAVALSVSLVVAVSSGYASVQATVFRFVASYLGTTDVRFSRQGDPKGRISAELVEELRHDPQVLRASPRLIVQATLADEAGRPLGDRPWQVATITGVQLPDDRDIAAQRMDEEQGGVWFDSSQPDAAVIDQVTARSARLKVGSRFSLPSSEGRLVLRVVGVVHKPQIMATFQPAVYVPLETLQRFAGAGGEVSMIAVTLHGGVDHDEFTRRWRQRLATDHPGVKVATAQENREQVRRNLVGVRMLSLMAGALALLAAAFIIFTTLSMGVGERQRILGMLRAVGARRRQLAALVITEGLILGTAGAAVGIPMGILWVWALVTWKQRLFEAGLVLDAVGIAAGAAAALLVALAASFLPAVNAMRLDPIAAITAGGRPPRLGFPLATTGIGLLLLSIDPALIFLPAVPRDAAFYGHLLLGLPAVLLGFFLLGPAFVWLIERTLAPAVAAVLRLRSALLSQQLSAAIWRASGTAAALMVGLAVLVVMQTQGRSMLSAWRLPDRFPDIFIFAPAGLTAAEARILTQVEGIRSEDVLPIAITVPRLSEGFFGLVGAALLPDATMFIGIEPHTAMRIMELEFREGNAADAANKLALGRHLIVTEEFRQLKGLHVGDKLRLKTPLSGEVDYQIAGVVWSPGLDVFVSVFDLGRQLDERSAGSVFGSLDDARRDFGVNRYHLFAANLDGVERGDLEARVRRKLGTMGLMFGDVRHIKYGIQRGFSRLLALMGTVPLFAMAVASLGVTNALMASIRARRWQFGVLRSVGATRWLLLRLVLAEALLLGLVGAAMGLAAGLFMSVNANGLLRKVTGFSPPIVIAWDVLWLGAATVILIAIAASLYPAIRAAAEQPLRLLQSGRAAA